MTKERFLQITNPKNIYGEILTPIEHVTSDSRKVRSGSCYVAISGFTVDGHDYIKEAHEAGAGIIIGEKNTSADGYCYIQVENSRNVLAPLVFETYGNPQKKLRFIGVTGTNGKTTVSTLIYQALSNLDYKAGLLGTVKTVIVGVEKESTHTTGTPEFLAETFSEMVSNQVEFCVMEVSSHALDQRRTAGISFEVAVFTNLSHDHLDYHKTVEAYRDAKKILFDGLEKNSTAIINADDENSAYITSNTSATCWEYGFNSGSDEILKNESDGLILKVDDSIIESPLSGLFNAYNVSAAWLALRAVGCSPANASIALSTATGAAGRLQKIESNTGITVFVDYAHTPDALENVASTLKKIKGNGQLITVFGCGGDRDKTKRPLMAKSACAHSDFVIITSDNPRTEEPARIIQEISTGIPSEYKSSKEVVDRSLAIREAINMAKPNDIVLIAGKGHETYQEIHGIRHPFDDVKEVEAALAHKHEEVR